jgi:HPt (histidine-containing phosphotransfer) domain-containing protein
MDHINRSGGIGQMIDWTRVKDLRDEIGEESFDEVAVLFLEEADEAVEKLDGSLAAAALESALHFLKGSALNLGFSTLATLCQDGERRAAGGSADVALDEIKTIYEASKSAFHSGRSLSLSA